MSDPTLDGLDYIYKDVLEQGITPNGRWTISAYEFMWMDTAIRQLKKEANLHRTILSHLSTLFGSEIIVPNILVETTNDRKAFIKTSFLPIEDGERIGDWRIIIDVKDVSEEGEIIED